ncbi:MAG: glycoside hydrolase family 15 protein [Deltaproteobacteria bacterium]|nr:glycoside hydrolase family 15 protein [Deltaproteobacteria bacterium]
MELERLGLVGNCQFSALIDDRGAVVWCCLPRFDSEPVFGGLLDPDGGAFRVGPADGSAGTQRYLENTNVLETTFRTPEGDLRVLDFAPRFRLHERWFRPTQLIRIVEPLSGSPRIRVECQPRLGWSKREPLRTHGSHHQSFRGFADELRLTTDLPLSYLDGRPLTLTGRRHIALTWGEPIEEPLQPLADRFLQATSRYWQTWVKQCNVPPRWQHATIRSALALKLHCFEDTGAIVAATTTSIAESPGSGRTWDYRYCWLRDATYALDAFRLLGQFEERQQFVSYLLNVAGSAKDLALAPLHRIDGRDDLDEQILPHWKGHLGEGPVRVGNGAARHVQHDIYGEMVLALAPIFLDERFEPERSRASLDLLAGLARKGSQVAGTPDAGIWELRTEWTPQTFSTLMCWAGVDRMARVAARHLPHEARWFADEAARLHQLVLTQGFDAKLGSLVASPGSRELDASLLQAVMLRLLPLDDPRLHGTVDAITRVLGPGPWLQRYRLDDGFGRPEVAFIICAFWRIEALAHLGRLDEARAAMDAVLATQGPLGLLSEDLDPRTGRMWGNFPQAYSHIGLVRAAFAASPDWSEVL